MKIFQEATFVKKISKPLRYLLFLPLGHVILAAASWFILATLTPSFSLYAKVGIFLKILLLAPLLSFVIMPTLYIFVGATITAVSFCPNKTTAWILIASFFVVQYRGLLNYCKSPSDPDALFLPCWLITTATMVMTTLSIISIIAIKHKEDVTDENDKELDEFLNNLND